MVLFYVGTIPVTLTNLVLGALAVLFWFFYNSSNDESKEWKQKYAAATSNASSLRSSVSKAERAAEALRNSLAEKDRDILSLRNSLSSVRHELHLTQSSLSQAEKEAAEFRHYLSSVSTREKLLSQREREVGDLYAEFEDHLSNIIQDQSAQYPYIAAQIADLSFLYDMKVSADLSGKPRAARKASESVAAIAKEKRELLLRVKALEYQLSSYESIVPGLSSLSDYSTSELCEASQAQSATDQDSALSWISDEEYHSLSDAEKYQLALDRWRHRNRSNWQVGRDFERYVGYLYETDGWKVTYYGSLNGKADLCRDLIASKGDKLLIIQCKRWAKEKTIHEKHVFQLFGSVISYRIANPRTNPSGLLITTCPLSDLAAEYARALEIDYSQNYPTDALDSYPLIKCNISKTGEKIFHLPFDQQYDRIMVSPGRGEFYAATVQEAMASGFRRAFRWHGSGL